METYHGMHPAPLQPRGGLKILEKYFLGRTEIFILEVVGGAILLGGVILLGGGGHRIFE